MSKEFFETMEEIVAISNKIKFWEGTHPEIESKNHDDILAVLENLKKVESNVTKELKKKAKDNPARKKKRTSKEA
jgi:hypothetical protein